MEIRGVNGQLGPTAIGAGQSSPSQTTPAAPPELAGQDQVNISPVARYLDRLAELPKARAERIASARQAVQAGQMDTPEKLSVAIDRMLDDLLAE